ncbi:MAG: hypothetical protein Q8N47_25805, partial [Bryobacterales bacterium]|nr:hypothetical protein [Bryobacterales bacterium]
MPPVLAAQGLSWRTSLKAAIAPCPELQAVDLPSPASLAAARHMDSRAIPPVLAAQSPSRHTFLKAAIAPCTELQAVDLPDPAPLRAATRRMDCRVYFPVLAAHGPACRTSLKAALAPCPKLQAVDLPDPASGVPLRPRAMTAGLLPPVPPDVAWQLSSPVRVAAPGELAALVALKWSFAPCRPARSGGKGSLALQFPAKPLAPKLALGTILSTQSEREIEEAATLAGLGGKLAPWMAVSRFWKTAPADLKWLSVALPAVLLVALVSAVGWLP